MNSDKAVSILVTDDESNIRMMVRTALESEGYEVREASNGNEALASIKRQPPDVMVLDLNMPELDGMAVLEQMKSLTSLRRPRVVILTAYGSIPAAVKALQLGASDFVEKPITPNDLRNTVRGVLLDDELDAVTLAPSLLDSYDRVLDRVRKSLRLANTVTAEALLVKAADHRGQHNAEYFNLLGVLYETQRKWRLARRCYNKSADSDPSYKPAIANLRRLHDLLSIGRTTQGVVLGDEPEDLMYFRLPDAKD